MKVRLVIFDMDGVLVNSHDAWFEAARSLMRTLGDDLTMEEFDQRCWGRPFGVAWRRNNMPVDDLRAAGEMIHREYLKQLDKVMLFPGIREMFGLLRKKGIKTALLSNSPKWVNEKVLQKVGLELDSIPDLSELKLKPHPDGILRIMKDLGIEKENTVFVGDTPTDEEAGKAAGITTLMVGRDMLSASELANKLGL
jgi:HAD superfamily hydrolase (TIGR01509 family)